MLLKRKKKTEEYQAIESQEIRRKSHRSDGSGRLLNRIAFYTFVVSAAVLLLRALLAYYIPAIAHTLDIIATVVQVVLYAIAGILAFRFVRKGRPVRLTLFVLAVLVLIAAAVLPLVFK